MPVAWPLLRRPGNLMRMAAAIVDDGGEIRVEHLPDDFLEDIFGAAFMATRRCRSASADQQMLAGTAARHGGKMSAAAWALGVSRNTIYREMLSAPDA